MWRQSVAKAEGIMAAMAAWRNEKRNGNNGENAISMKENRKKENIIMKEKSNMAISAAQRGCIACERRRRARENAEALRYRASSGKTARSARRKIGVTSAAALMAA
jgi:hypothetical protein